MRNSTLLALKRLNSHVIGLRFSVISQELKDSRSCHATSDTSSANEATKAANDRTLSHLVEQTKELPFLYAYQRLDIGKALFEQPFVYRPESKKKKRKRKQKVAKGSEKIQETVSDLTINADDSATVTQAVKIYNSIPQGERIHDSENFSKVKDKSPLDLINQLRNSKPHILGLAGNEFKSRYDYLSSLGIEKTEALRIALDFPSFLNLQNNNVANLIKLYSGYKVDLPKMFCNFPFAFSLPYIEVVKKLDHLGSVGLKKKDVSALLNNNPNIICFELNEVAKTALKFSTSFSGWKSSAAKSNFIESLLRTAGQEQFYKYEFDDNFASASSFLTELNIPINDLFRKCPNFFSTDKDEIYHIMCYLGGAPFYFDAEDVGKFLQKFPSVFLQLGDEKVKDQIDYVCKNLGKDADLYELIQTSPKMLTDSDCLKGRIELFQHWNFKSSHISYLMKKFPILFIENRVVENLEDRLQFLLSNGDLSVNDVMKFPFCLQMRIVLLRCKIGFIRNKKPEVLKTTGLQEIFTAKVEKFVIDICSATFSEFFDFMKSNFSNADQEWIKRKGKPREIKALSESF